MYLISYRKMYDVLRIQVLIAVGWRRSIHLWTHPDKEETARSGCVDEIPDEGNG